MSKSSQKRATRNARLIAATMIVPPGATMPYTPADARQAAREDGFDSLLMSGANWNLVSELLNRRMPKRFPGKARTFEPYENFYPTVYVQSNPDPVRPRRERVESEHVPDYPSRLDKPQSGREGTIIW